MSKIICDVCGTTYPETAVQCPICGCAKNTTAQTAAGDGAQAGEASYAYVKGGRFSKSNVRKRNKTGKEPERRTNADQPPKGEKKDNTNKILAVIVVLLLLAIVAVLAYMGLRVFFPDLGKPEDPADSTTASSEVTESTESTETSTPAEIPCTAIALSNKTLTFTDVTQATLLSVTVAPSNTTDTIVYESSDESIVTVTAGGKVTPVAGGKAVIIVTCGDMIAECEVICTFGDYQEPTESAPTEAPVQIPEGFVLKLKQFTNDPNNNSFTLSAKYPAPVAVYRETNGVKATDITWTVDDPKVASVDENGVVSAVGRGTTVVRGTIGDQTASVTVYVAFDPQPATEPKYKLSHTDVTLYVGDATLGSFRITLTDSNGVNIDAEWTVSDEGYVTINGRNITAVKATSDLAKRAVTISATVDGETYTCTVRVAEKPAEETQSGT